MPSTEGLSAKLSEAGKQGRKAFEEGFNGGTSADTLGSSFGQKFMAGFQKHVGAGDFGALGGAIDKLGAQVDEKLANRLRGQLPEAYRTATTAANELREAQERLARATELVNDRTQTANISQYVAARHQQYQAEQDVAAATTRSAAAQHEYTEKMESFTAASRSAFSASSMLGGLVGGSVVAGFQMLGGAMEGVIHLGEHVFDEALNGAEELTEKLVEAGEQFEQISNQVTEFSGASGPALDELKDRAAAVFGTLDVEGKDVGRTMSELSTRLHMEPGSALDDLTRKVEDLGGRFRSLKSESIATLFTDFNISGEQANAALDTLVQNARNAGVDMGQLTSTMAGPVAETMQEAGLNFSQTAHVVALMTAQGIPATDVVRGLGSAMKLFAKDGLSFRDGIAEARKELQQLGDTAAGNALASKLFGTKWADAVKIIGDLNATLDATPGQFDGAAGAADNLIGSTETLDNKIQAFKNHTALAFKPFEEGAINALDNGLSGVQKWFDEHHDEIINDIRHFGLAFIDAIPEIKDFADAMLGMLQAIAPPLEGMVSLMFAGAAAMEALSGHFDTAGKMLDLSGKFGLSDPIGDAIDKIKPKMDLLFDDAIKNSDKLKDSLNQAADAAQNIYVPPPQGFSWWNDYQSPSFNYPNTPGKPGAPAPTAPAAPSAPAAPTPNPLAQSPIGPGTTGGPKTPGQVIMPGAPAGNTITHYDLWQRVAQAESSGNWSNADTGHNGHYGGLQFAPSTWNAYGGQQFAPMPNQATPEQQMIVAERTAFTGWNGTPPQGLGAWETIANGAVKTASKGLHVTGGVPGQDSVLIAAMQGEYVWAKETVDKFGPLIDKFNTMAVQGFAGGGLIAAESWAAAQNGQPYTYGNLDCSGYVASVWGILTGKGPGHWFDTTAFASDSTAAQYGFVPGTMPGALNIAVNPEPGQHGHMMGQFPDGTYFESGGKDSSAKFGGNTSSFAGFEKHFYLAGLPQAPGTGGGFPAITAGYGGGGFGASVFGGGSGFGAAGFGAGGQTPDEQREHQRAIERAHDRIANLNRQIQDKSDDVTRLQNEYDKLNADHTVARDQAKIDATNRQLQRAKEDLDKLKNQDLREANEDLDDANRKAAEPGRGGRRGEHGGQYNMAEELGRGLLSGIAQELGFPDVFGKAPWEFGSFKLAAGLANWGLGTMRAMGSGAAGLPAPEGGGGQFPISPSALPITQGLGAPGSPHGWPIGPGNNNRPQGTPTFLPGPTPPTPGGATIHNTSMSFNIHPSTDKNIVHDVKNFAASHNYAQMTANAPGSLPAAN